MVDADDIRFVMDGVTYVAVEDPEDGYRSRMDRIVADGSVEVKNTFPPRRVFCHMGDVGNGEGGLLAARDMVTGGMVLLVGTDASDIYYPRFIREFTPGNMAVDDKRRGEQLNGD